MAQCCDGSSVCSICNAYAEFKRGNAMRLRQTLEVDLTRLPFREGETLLRYARRVVHEAGFLGIVADVEYILHRAEVTTHSSPTPEFAPIGERVRIELVDAPGGGA